jgi:hypothetical protein
MHSLTFARNLFHGEVLQSTAVGHFIGEPGQHYKKKDLVPHPN